MMAGGDFRDGMDEHGVDGAWTRRTLCSTKQGKVDVRTRPDWALVSADRSRWRIRRAGVHVGEAMFASSDHRPVGIEIAAVDGDLGLRKEGRVRPQGFFDATRATDEQMLWRGGLFVGVRSQDYAM